MIIEWEKIQLLSDWQIWEMERDESYNEGVNTSANMKIYHYDITWIQNNSKFHFFFSIIINLAIQFSLTFYTQTYTGIHYLYSIKCIFYIFHRIKWWMQIIPWWIDNTKKVCVWPCLELDYMRWTNWLNVKID